MFPAPWGRRPPSATARRQLRGLLRFASLRRARSRPSPSRSPPAAAATTSARTRTSPGRLPGRGQRCQVPRRSAPRPDQRPAARDRERRATSRCPNLAVTIFTGDVKAGGSFSVRSEQPGLADPNRPVWILENGYPKLAPEGDSTKDLDAAPSAGAAAAQTDTFAFGPLEAGGSKDIVWRVTPVVAGDLHGQLRARRRPQRQGASGRRRRRAGRGRFRRHDQRQAAAGERRRQRRSR